ncbi:Prophage antirepressor [Xylella fastidiosa EB92.1]|nr:Prophage antirepressor [Xylella fastidiosa EB92.1]
MNEVTPFQFESKDVRIQLDEASAPWFNANDVCSILEFGNPRQAIESHVDVEDVQKLDATDNLGRTRQTNHINESGLYALIMGSTKPAAKRFKRWVTSEVLPTLRKTGTYSTPGALPTLPGPTQDRIAALLLIGQYISTVPGVKPGIAAAATLACIKSNTNLTTEEIRRALPALRDPLCMLNATQLGKQLHCSAKVANQLLASSGLQFRNERDAWELTEAGRMWGEAIPYSRNGHSSYQILWNPTVLDSLKVAA